MCSCMQTLQQVVGDKDEDEIELSPDFKFLLNLLVLGSGIAPAITAMTVLEPVRKQKYSYFDFLSFLESSQSCGAKGDKDRPDQDRQPAGRRRLTCSW